MKKFFTLAASLLVLSANAQTVKNLDSSLVFYLTNDTVSTQMVTLLESGDLNGAFALATLMLLVFIVFYSISFVLDEKGTSNV